MFDAYGDPRPLGSNEAIGDDPPCSANAVLAGILFHDHGAELLGYLRRRLDGNRQVAEDMAQEALARIAAAGRDYAGFRARGLLFSVARNLLIDHFRAERARHHATAAIEATHDEIEPLDPLRTLVAREDLERVRRAIHALPERCRQIFVLNRFEHMSYADIARHCGISVSMVEKHIQRALRQLGMALNAEAGGEIGIGEDK